ncbi:family 1 glycosylhydrolase [Schaalia naturae]|uniref:Family 1 glycosylhydrolase n=1 Tax=Schaalia naturae TaxID=635203 RepID=A0ABW2SNB6_9ACTO
MENLSLGVGIEDTFIPQEAPGMRKLDEYELTQHYTYWREDLRLAAECGARYVRWGVPWYLVEPEQGEYDFRWIDEVAEHTQSLGLDVVVDLLHYGTPLWLDNSFLNASYPEHFGEYAGAVADRYKDVFRSYTPVNEPMVNVLRCGRQGLWPPYLRGEDGLVKVLGPLCRGMAVAAQRIRETVPDARLVHVDAGFRWAGSNFPNMGEQLLGEWRFLATDLYLGRVDGSHPMVPYLRENGMADSDLDWFQDHAGTFDIMGVNYYPATSTVRYGDSGEEIFVDRGVEGLTDLLRAYWTRYGIPLAVTETSRNESDRAKAEWLAASLEGVDDLRAEGIPVVGYTWFPLLSLVDWTYRESCEDVDGFWNRLGLYDLQRGASRELRRVPSTAVDLFRREAESRRSPSR